MHSRRLFLKRAAKAGFVTATSPLWTSAAKAFGQVPDTGYKAVVVISLVGGNDANNMIIPLDPAAYAEYAAVRGALAIPADKCLPLLHGSGEPSYGLHPALSFIQQEYNSKQALFAANVGPIERLVTKAQYISDPSVGQFLFSHPTGVQQWESALTSPNPTTGWGGRMADLLVDKSGRLPPVLSTNLLSTFTFGQTVQAVAVQSGAAFTPLPPDLTDTVLQIAEANANSKNALLAKVAQLRVSAMKQQSLINQARAYQPIKTQFYLGSGCSASLLSVAQIIAGRPVTGATRQIFYVAQGAYDNHTNQLGVHFASLDELNYSLQTFCAALDELGIRDQVLICTLSDFNRTFAPNVDAGTDHGWGTHQIVMGGGITGGRILGTMPTLEINGPDDANGYGAWLPTTSVTQFTAGVGSWMGLTSQQLAATFPELSNFSRGAMTFA